MSIDYIHYKLIDSMLLLLYIIYKLGLLYQSYDGSSKNIKHIVYMLQLAALTSSIGHPTTISRQYRPSFTIQYNRHEQWINIPSMTAPQQYRWCANGQKSMPLRRRRISSPIYAAARHYHHQLTCEDLPERCLAGYDAIGPQLEAYEGRRWPSFSRRRGGLPSFCVLCGGSGQLASQLELLYIASPTSQANQVDNLGDLWAFSMR